MADLSAGIEILTKEEFLEYTDLDKMDISDVIEFDKFLFFKLPPFRETLNDDLGEEEEEDYTNVNFANASAVSAYARVGLGYYKNR